MLKRLSKREKRIFYILVTVILLGLLYNFAIEPFVKNWIKTDREIKAAEVKLIKSNKLVASESYSLESYDKYLNNLKPQGSDEEEMAQLLANIEDIATKTSVKIVEMKPLPVQRSDFYKRFLIDISAESQMNQLTEFLYNIQKSPLILKVSRLNLTSDPRQPGQLRVQLAICRIIIK